MWYFSWILGLLLACSLGVISLLWLEAQVAWKKEHIKLDAVTHLIDRNEIKNRLREKIENSKRSDTPFAIVLMSLRAFREKNNLIYNDMDTIMRSVASSIQKEIRVDLDIVSRFDKNEFLIACPGSYLGAAQNLAQRMVDNIAQDVRTKDRVPVQASTGVAEYSVHADEFDLDDETTMSEVDALIQSAAKRLVSG